MKHPSEWSQKHHYGQCGQSCPCCRSKMGDKLGSCTICTKIMKHPSEWSQKYHYGQCGQSCPCCRSKMGDKLGSCTICYKLEENIKA